MNLTNEHHRAVKVLKKQLKIIEQNIIPETTKFSSMFTTGFTAYSKTIRFVSETLPKENAWSWSQSNSRFVVNLDPNKEAVIYKMSPRKKTNCPKPPSYKVWIYNVSCTTNGEFLFDFLWCEKGVHTHVFVDENLVLTEKKESPETGDTSKNIKSHEESSVHIIAQEPTLQDYSFLAPFVDEVVAKEFGWGDHIH